MSASATGSLGAPLDNAESALDAVSSCFDSLPSLDGGAISAAGVGAAAAAVAAAAVSAGCLVASCLCFRASANDSVPGTFALPQPAPGLDGAAADDVAAGVADFGCAAALTLLPFSCGLLLWAEGLSLGAPRPPPRPARLA